MKRSLLYPMHQSFHFNQWCKWVTIFCIWLIASLPNIPVEIQDMAYYQES